MTTSERMSINGSVLRWARETAGLSIEDVAHKLKKQKDVIEAWENEDAHPTYKQLEKLAYEFYKRPLALFFFPEPPEEESIKQSFRTLPDSEIRNIPPRIRYLLRQAKVYQLNMGEIHSGRNQSESIITRDLDLSLNEDVPTLAKKARDYLNMSLEQQKNWRNAEEALKKWREVIEDKGILVFKESFKNTGKNQPDSAYSGFCVYDQNFPIIYVNNNFPETRQIFTLFHELAHLLFAVGGIHKLRDEYLHDLHGDEWRIEILCNKFASEFLIPSENINPILQDIELTDSNFSRIADEYCVSREVILRRMLDLGIVDRNFLSERVAQWNSEREQKNKNKTKGGGNYYSTQSTYLSKKYMEGAFTQYYQEKISRMQLADYLGTKIGGIDNFEEKVLKKA